MRRADEENAIDILGKLVFYAMSIVVVAALIWMVQPVALIPIVVVLAIAAVAWHEAKVPFGPPEIARRGAPPRQAARMSTGFDGMYAGGGQVRIPPPLELEARARPTP